MIDMKNLIKSILGSFLFTAFLFSCKKDENKVYFEGGTDPVLTASSTADMVLDSTNAANVTAIVFNWTNPEYKFNTGISSQDVTYILQIDTSGSNFTNPKMQEVAIAKNLRYTPSVKEFNAFFNKMELRYGMPHHIEFRIKSTLAGGLAVPLYSNVIKMVITPYLDVAVPIPTHGTLWAIGNAFASGWDNPMKDPYTASQKFTQVSETLYTLTVNFVGGGTYKLIQDQGNWDTQYHPKYSADVPFDAGNFEKKNSDPGWVGPASAGTYKITINFITGTYKVEKV
jgi:hypothetical protein